MPPASIFASYVERIYHAGITAGCSASPLDYCPGSNVTRAQMAVFLERGIHGSAYVPPAATGIFADVPACPPLRAMDRAALPRRSHRRLRRDQLLPDGTVTRAQMAVFLIKARHPVTCTYPSSGSVFTDVPAGYWAGGYVEQLWHEGVTGGAAAGVYCPESAVAREQMAAFLVRGFRLP